MTVQLRYDKDCPNLGEARANLHRALTAAGLPASWPRPRPHSVPSGLPPCWRTDATWRAPIQADAACCRVYGSPAGGAGLRRPS